MMISEPTSTQSYKDAYVWIWLPGEVEPVVAGKLVQDAGRVLFNYGKSYLQRSDAISIYAPELPLQAGVLPLAGGLSMPNCIRDASPDAWGRRVLINRMLGTKGARSDTARLGELSYLLESGSDRIGALDFQLSPQRYVPREAVNASLEELMESATRVENGIPLTPELDQALNHGSSIGGARPKALINSGNKKYIAKFSSSADVYSVVKVEYIAMRLARLAGLNVAGVSLARASHKDVLLIERFDRVYTGQGWRRRCIVSALTLLGLDEMMARYASYETMAEIIRHRFDNAPETLRELFSRIVFNILCGNTDDHARNHAAFWDGRMLSLTPAYDLCPQGRSGNEASQAMLISGGNRMSRLAGCLDAAPQYLLPRSDAKEIIANQIQVIEGHWDEVCDEAALSRVDRAVFWRRQFLNPYAFEGYKD